MRSQTEAPIVERQPIGPSRRVSVRGESRHAPRPASSLIVAAAYVRLIRSDERMTTTYTTLNARSIEDGDLGPKEWTSPHSLPWEDLSHPRPKPSRATPSAPRASCEEDASLPSQFLSRGLGLDSPIELPRASHELERGRPIQAVIGLSSPNESADSTVGQLGPRKFRCSRGRPIRPARAGEPLRGSPGAHHEMTRALKCGPNMQTNQRTAEGMESQLLTTLPRCTSPALWGHFVYRFCYPPPVVPRSLHPE